jgi:cyclohexyl-isocyanide hydratase
MTPFDSTITRSAFAGGAVAAASAIGTRSATAAVEPAPMRMPSTAPSGPKPTIAMLVYPGMILLDLVGPQSIFTILGCEIHLVAQTRETVSTDVGIGVVPTATFTTCPETLDVLFVPGGLMGSIASMNDPQTIAFLQRRAERARFVTSVCTGGLVLGGAGLLRGYRATAHWGVADLLPLLGAVHVAARVVRDRNRITAAGATAGLDFGLTLAALLRGDDAAKHAQLILEYAPEPPFHAGTPHDAGPAMTARERKQRVYMDQDARAATIVAARRLGLAAAPATP